ncbi:MAG: DNA replication and repair protein RecF [Candidatus Coatesbacteria bacterium]
MPLASLKLTCFRGYESASVDLGPGLTLFVGDNAQGKTNLLRAAEVLGLGAAPEAAAGDLVRWGAAAGSIEGRIATDEDVAPVRLVVGLARGGLRLALNGKMAPRPRWIGLCPVLFVGPEDRDQVTGPPSARRALLDELLEQGEPRYLAALREYRRALRQRNRALGDQESQDGEIEIWEEPMARAGGVLLAHRVRALDQLGPRAAAWHRELAGGDADRGLGLAYQSGVAAPAGSGAEAWGAALADALAAGRLRDRAVGTTLTGPHRDEVAIALAGHPLKGSGSSGEIWTAILALALASAEALSSRLGRLPVLLLDDVLAALDRTRCDRLLGIAASLPQVLLTATTVSGAAGAAPAAATWTVRNHALERLGTGRERDDGWRSDTDVRELLARC